VDVDILPVLPQFLTVGLPDVAVKESKDRIKAAINNSGYKFPNNYVTVNLAPAYIEKERTGFELPIAVGMPTGKGCIELKDVFNYILIGELSLDGNIKGIDGVLPAAIRAKGMGKMGIIVARENADEAAMVEAVEVIPVDVLSDIVEFLKGGKQIIPLTLYVADLSKSCNYHYDLSSILC